ncbi:unnamed protein product [Lactuca saligna]|uniref:Uncharacterized protein n=1 Tax=Lactuca saligna TaxID=75948 RepID=A0AA36EN99_LACSI|nr:unnamed protein product [Lactuca saligna]
MTVMDEGGGYHRLPELINLEEKMVDLKTKMVDMKMKVVDLNTKIVDLKMKVVDLKMKIMDLKTKVVAKNLQTQQIIFLPLFPFQDFGFQLQDQLVLRIFPEIPNFFHYPSIWIDLYAQIKNLDLERLILSSLKCFDEVWD